MKIRFRDITKLPNLLSVFRILLIPVFVLVFLWENGEVNYPAAEGTGSGYVIAAIILIISGLTDMADGFIARRFNMITDLGKALDPFADKLTQAAVVICLIFRYKEICPLLIVLFVMIFIKEITLLIMGVLFLRKGQDLGGAKWFGKVATVVFYVLVVLMVGAPVMPLPAAVSMVCVMGMFTILTFVLYMWEYYKMRRDRDNDNS